MKFQCDFDGGSKDYLSIHLARNKVEVDCVAASSTSVLLLTPTKARFLAAELIRLADLIEEDV